MGDRASLPSSAGKAAQAPFILLLRDSEHFIQWVPPPQGDTSSGGGEESLVVVLGWLGAHQKHLRRYADLYRDHGFGSLRFIFPLSQLVGRHFGRRFERRIARLSAMIVAWCDGEHHRTLLFHTFSNTGWLAYGMVLESLQARADIIERIRGCIIDSAPVFELRPEFSYGELAFAEDFKPEYVPQTQVWAAGFSVAMLKKKTRPPSADSPDGPTLNGALKKHNSVSKLTRPSWSETIVLSTLRKFFEIVLHVPDVNKRLRKLQAILSDKQPSCPQFYLYSSADKVMPAEYVESFINTQIALGLSVSAHNFVSSPHVDHYRNFPHLYSAKLDEFLNVCFPARITYKM